MKNYAYVLLLVVALLLPGHVLATPTSVDWKILGTLDLPESPQDMAIAPDGRLYLLTGDGQVRIIAADGRPLGTIEVGSGADQIHLGPGGERLYVSDRKGRKLKVIALADVAEIPLNGSPFLGSAEAAITVVVFSDFQ